MHGYVAAVIKFELILTCKNAEIDISIFRNRHHLECINSTIAQRPVSVMSAIFMRRTLADCH